MTRLAFAAAGFLAGLAVCFVAGVVAVWLHDIGDDTTDWRER